MNDEPGLTKVEFRVDDGEGGVNVETPWVRPLGNNLFALENCPFYAYGVSWQDTIEAEIEDPEGFPVFKRVVEKSGNKTVRVIFDPPVEDGNASQERLDELVALGCSYEGANRTYIVVNIPPDVDLWPIREFLISSGLQWEHADPTYDDLFADGQ